MTQIVTVKNGKFYRNDVVLENHGHTCIYGAPDLSATAEDLLKSVADGIYEIISKTEDHIIIRDYNNPNRNILIATGRSIKDIITEMVKNSV